MSSTMDSSLPDALEAPQAGSSQLDQGTDVSAADLENGTTVTPAKAPFVKVDGKLYSKYPNFSAMHIIGPFTLTWTHHRTA